MRMEKCLQLVFYCPLRNTYVHAYMHITPLRTSMQQRCGVWNRGVGPLRTRNRSDFCAFGRVVREEGERCAGLPWRRRSLRLSSIYQSLFLSKRPSLYHTHTLSLFHSKRLPPPSPVPQPFEHTQQERKETSHDHILAVNLFPASTYILPSK